MRHVRPAQGKRASQASASPRGRRNGARPLQIEYEEALYHLTGRGNERHRIFTEEDDYTRFLELLEESLEHYAKYLRA
jgi:hypothetical protein